MKFKRLTAAAASIAIAAAAFSGITINAGAYCDKSGWSVSATENDSIASNIKDGDMTNRWYTSTTNSDVTVTIDLGGRNL